MILFYIIIINMVKNTPRPFYLERQTKLQIEYQNMSLSGSREGASPTTRLEDGTILSYPADETEDGANFKQSTGEFVKVDKKSYTVDSDKLTDVIDTKITVDLSFMLNEIILSLIFFLFFKIFSIYEASFFENEALRFFI